MCELLLVAPVSARCVFEAPAPTFTRLLDAVLWPARTAMDLGKAVLSPGMCCTPPVSTLDIQNGGQHRF